jgi:hypothetical protein
VRRHLFLFLIGALLTVGSYAQDGQSSPDRGKTAVLTEITIQDREIKGDDVLIHKGTAYVSLPALIEALRATLVSQGQVAVLSIPTGPDSPCGETAAALRLSDAYRKAAVRIPQEIANLRVQALKRGALIPGASFDDIDNQIRNADLQAKTEADKFVSYALSHASSVLAIMYYRLRRGTSPEYAKQDEMDLELCRVESGYALEFGRLSGAEGCSVFQSIEKPAEAKAAPNPGN